MKKTTLIIGLAVIAGIIAITSLSLPFDSNSQTAEARTAVVYKSPSCGCCSVFASYLDKYDDYEVKTEDRDDMSSIKTKLDVPRSLESCHTTELDGYVIEGHIPEDAIQKLLSERPDIKGIGMAGMPAGSPGMPGPKTADFVIYEITHQGEKGDVFMRI